MAKIDSNKLYGRKEELEVIKSKLRKNSFLALISPRLGGKSALLSKGLKPSLEQDGFQGKAGNQWKVLILEPENDPIASLSEVMAQKNILMEKNIRPDFEEYLYDYLSDNNNNLAYLYKESEYIKDYNLLLIVDNVVSLFEENNKEKDDFLDLLLTAAFREDVAIYVLFALAKEELNYIPNTQRFARLWEAIESSNYQLFAMNQSELEEALLKTMEESGNKLDSHFTSELLDELYFDEEQLPNLRNYLSKIESGLDSREIKKDLYKPKIKGKGGKKDTSGINHITKKHVSGSQLINRGTETRRTVKHTGSDAIFKKLKTRYQQSVCQGIFKSLVYRNDESGELEFKKRSIKQIAELTDFPISELGKVIEIFSKAGILSTNNELFVAKSIVILDDEGILSGWKTLETWVEAEAGKQKFYLQICALANQFLATDDKDLCIVGPPLNKLHELIREGEISETWSTYFNDDFGKLEPYMNACDIENRSYTPPARSRGGRAQPSKRPARPSRSGGKIQIGIKKGGQTPKIKVNEDTASPVSVPSSSSSSIEDKMAILKSKYGIDPFASGEIIETPPADDLALSAKDSFSEDTEIESTGPDTEADNLVGDLLDLEVEIEEEEEEVVDEVIDEEEEEALDLIDDLLEDIEIEEKETEPANISEDASIEKPEEPISDLASLDIKEEETQPKAKSKAKSKVAKPKTQSKSKKDKPAELKSEISTEPEEASRILDDFFEEDTVNIIEKDVEDEIQEISEDVAPTKVDKKAEIEQEKDIPKTHEKEIKEVEETPKKIVKPKPKRQKITLKKLNVKSKTSPKKTESPASSSEKSDKQSAEKPVEAKPKKAASGTPARKKLVIKKRK